MPRLTYQQTLPITIEEAWLFFSNPANLAKITPGHLQFKILYNDAPEGIYPGCLISYRLKPVGGIPVRWITEITQVESHKYFIDNQIKGPYKLWHHQHHFKAVEGGTLMVDKVTYEIGYSLFGWIAGWLFVNRMVRGIFTYREKVLRQVFNAK